MGPQCKSVVSAMVGNLPSSTRNVGDKMGNSLVETKFGSIRYLVESFQNGVKFCFVWS